MALKSSHHKEKKFFPLVSITDDGCSLNNVVIIKIYISQVILCPINLYSAVCQLYLNKNKNKSHMAQFSTAWLYVLR